MAVTPTGILSLPLGHLRTLIANSSNFQTWVGAANATEAESSIYLVNINEDEIARPFALIDWGENFNSTMLANGPGGFFQDRGELRLLFEDDVAAENQDSYEDSKLKFLNDIGGVLADMRDLSASDEYLSIHEIQFQESPTRSIDDQDPAEGDFYQGRFIITWGV